MFVFLQVVRRVLEGFVLWVSTAPRAQHTPSLVALVAIAMCQAWTPACLVLLATTVCKVRIKRMVDLSITQSSVIQRKREDFHPHHVNETALILLSDFFFFFFSFCEIYPCFLTQRMTKPWSGLCGLQPDFRIQRAFRKQ